MKNLISRYDSSIYLVILAVFVLSSCNAQGSDTKESIESKIDTYLQPYLEMDAWSGNVAIYKNGEPLFQKSYGFADREWNIKNTMDTKFRIASISKLFTEVAILQLSESEKLQLDDTLSKYIIGYPRGEEITIQQLLNHRAGIPHLNSFPNYNELIKFNYTIDEIIELFKSKPLDFKPGEKYRYSNSGYVLLAKIIEIVSGKSYRQYLEDRIFKPYGLKATGIDSNSAILNKRAKGYMFNNDAHLINAEFVDMSIKIGGGSLYSTTDDLNLFVQKLVKGEILKSSFEKLPNFSTKNGQRAFATNGRVQGFCHQVIHWMDDNLTIVLLGNHYSNVALPITEDIYKIYSGKNYQTPTNYIEKRQSVTNKKLQEYQGTYDFGFGPIGVVKVIDNNLMYMAPGRTKADKLIPLGNDTFFYVQNWVLLKFVDRKEKKYNTLQWIMGDNTYPAKRINQIKN
ncbi:serine hydrolase domain-containing protein [Winogradskyella haliclonae]|uniref:Beta-lactamase-related domain-containing protein n=1 Tax=Winogradskyella haliclonae TaxID=2048558 RepID=A0ABQ2BYH9_9FLAO|nr:serine hydrolase domain-containing protein [Winogradskyella haliclonae]GGI56960.1 hypothetical protein GCM10011444_12690 [Winogradskyella haliclonae]